MTQKILFDTDIGSDIDDAVCLAYLLAQPECELLGITTVTGECDKRAQLASALCRVAGKDIPIFPGADRPLLRSEQLQKYAPQAEALTHWSHQKDFPKYQAIEFMRQMIRSNPGEVTLLSVGPLTNVALLFRTDPEVASLLKSLVMMCGVFTNRLAGVGPLEWNAMLDPTATAITYQTPVKIHRSIGLDVTCQVVLPACDVRKRFQGKLLSPVLDFAEIWFKNAEKIYFHDPLAGVSIFDPEVCQFEKGFVEVELTSKAFEGCTIWKAEDASQGNGIHEVALRVNPDQFFESYFKVFN